MSWLAPSALAGLILLAVPILIHLLTREERRLVPFPSLRFLKASRFTALKRRIIDDWPLLVLRLTATACAVAALAGPLLITETRQRRWATRVSRAILVTDAAPSLDEERRTAFTSAIFPLGEHASDALQTTVGWLNAQRPSAREIVIAGDLRASMLSDADLSVVPADVGLRFLPVVEGALTRDVVVPALQKNDRGAVALGIRVRLEDAHSTVSGASMETTWAAALAVRAAPDDVAVAEASLRAVLAQQVVLDQAAQRKVVVAWPGADLGDLGPAVMPAALEWIPPALERLARPAQQHGDALVVRVPWRPVDEQAAIELRDIARAVFVDARSSLEPRRAAPADLARWSRPPGAASPATRPEDQGDRRWLWAAALTLLVVEHAWRRGRRSPNQPMGSVP
jgi:Aerotolerance regulator N-terminal